MARTKEVQKKRQHCMVKAKVQKSLHLLKVSGSLDTVNDFKQ